MQKLPQPVIIEKQLQKFSTPILVAKATIKGHNWIKLEKKEFIPCDLYNELVLYKSLFRDSVLR